MLINYIKNKFDIEFKLKYRKDCKNYILELNKRNELIKFINLVKSYISEIPCIKYKINMQDRLHKKALELHELDSNKTIILCTLDIIKNNYSSKDEELIIRLKNNKIPDKEIARILNKTYYDVIDKIRRLRIEGKL